MARIINICSDVPLVDEVTGEPLNTRGEPCAAKDQDSIRFADFFLRSVLNDQKWGADFESLRLMMDLAAKFGAARRAGAASFEVSETEWSKLADVVRKPSAPYLPAAARRIPHFFAAILEAPKDVEHAVEK